MFAGSFDTRVHILTEEIEVSWEPRVQAQHWEARIDVLEGIAQQYGVLDQARKVADFVALGSEPFSLLSFHNKFYRQARSAFIAGAYYPALVGTCALGERLLNHLILTLREDFRSSSAYRLVYGKESFDDWSRAIDTLAAWNVLYEGVQADLERLRDIRNAAPISTRMRVLRPWRL